MKTTPSFTPQQKAEEFWKEFKATMSKLSHYQLEDYRAKKKRKKK